MREYLNKIYRQFSKLQAKYSRLEIFSDEDPYLQGYLDGVQACRNIMTVEMQEAARQEQKEEKECEVTR